MSSSNKLIVELNKIMSTCTCTCIYMYVYVVVVLFLAWSIKWAWCVNNILLEQIIVISSISSDCEFHVNIM